MRLPLLLLAFIFYHAVHAQTNHAIELNGTNYASLPVSHFF